MLKIAVLFSLRTWKPRGHSGNLSKLSHNIAERVLLCCRHEDTALVLSASNKQSPVASHVDASVALCFLSRVDETAQRRARPKRGCRYPLEVAHAQKRIRILVPMA